MVRRAHSSHQAGRDCRRSSRYRGINAGSRRSFRYTGAVMQTLLVASAVGPDSPGIAFELARAVRESGCSLKDSRMAVLGGEFCAQFLIEGNWSAVAKLEQLLPRAAEKLSMDITLRRTEARPEAHTLIPYSVEVVALERPGIVEEVTEFFACRGIGVEDLYTTCYIAPQTQAPMFTMHMTAGVPAETAIAGLRTEFLELCDDLNIDAVLTAFK
jgi:glycine cleavage system transcriptional repressor